MPAWSGSLPTSTCPCRTTIATRPCGSTPTRSRECRRSRSRPDSRKRAPMSARWSISAICRNEAADARAAMPRSRSRRSIGRRNSQSLVRWGIVMCGTGKGALRRLTCLLALLAMSASAALAQGATLRLGYGTAAEEPIWLLVARPDLAKNQGKAYALDATRFTGSDKRGQAFEAGAIDLAASSANGVIFAAAEGVTARIIASVSRRKLARLQHELLRQGELSRPIGERPQGQGRRHQRLLHLGSPLAENRAREAWPRRDRRHHHAGPVPGDAGGARRRQGRSRSVPAAVRGARGEADEGAQDLRCQVRRAVRGGADRPDREGRVPEEECACDPGLPRGPEIGDPVLSRQAARGAPAPGRPQDGARQSRGLREHERLLSRSEPAGRRRGAGEDAGVPDQGRIPEEARRRQVADRSLLPAEVKHESHFVCETMTCQRTRRAPSPRRGEGWGEGVRIYRETTTPHPTPLPMGEGAHRVRGRITFSIAAPEGPRRWRCWR